MDSCASGGTDSISVMFVSIAEKEMWSDTDHIPFCSFGNGCLSVDLKNGSLMASVFLAEMCIQKKTYKYI